MTKAELIAALAPFDDETDVWIHAPGRVSEKATALKYVPPMGSDYAFVRIVAEPSTVEGKPMSHPWADFLAARARVIDWMYYGDVKEYRLSDEAIAKALSMDATQVYLIRTRDEKPGDNKGHLRAVPTSGDGS